MSLPRRILTNTASLIFGSVFSRAITFVIAVYLARYLDVERFGLYSFIFAYLAFFETAIGFGMGQVVVREVARRREEAGKILGNVLLITLAFTFFSLTLACLLIGAFSYPLETKFLTCFAALHLFLGCRGVFEVIFRVDLRMGYSVAINILRSILYGLLILIVVALKGSLWHVISASLLAGTIALLAQIKVSLRYVRLSFRPDWTLCWWLLRESFPLALTSFVSILYGRMDIMMLSGMKGQAAVGYYSAATRLLEILYLIPSSLITSLYPILSQASDQSKERLHAVFHRTFTYLLISVVPLAVIAVMTPDRILTLFYGAKYLAAAAVLPVLMGVGVIVAANFLLYSMLTILGHQKVDPVASSVQTVCLFALNFWLIPRYGFMGAGIARGVSDGIGFLLVGAYLALRLGLPMPLGTLAKTLLSGLLLYVFLIPIHTLPLAWVTVLGTALYVLLLLFFRILGRSELRLAQQLMRG